MGFPSHDQRRKGERMNSRYTLVVNAEQDRLLTEKMMGLGFAKKSDYIRFILFMDSSFVQKIDKIYNKVCENARKN